MENLNDADKVRQLFSSFISSLGNERASKNSHIETRLDVSSANSLSSCTTDQQKHSGYDKSTAGEKKADGPDSRNKTEFYQRVETYSITWCAKPMNLSPLVCARYGWLNVDVDMLQCSHCRAFLCGQLPKTVGSQNYKDSCNKLKQNLQDSHEKLCKWSSTPSPEIFTQVPCDSRPQILKDFCSRVKSFECIDDRLPDISYSSIVDQTDEKKLSEERLHDIVEKITSYLNEINIKCTEKTIVYSLTGWAYQESQKNIQVLQCNYCCRKVGLWNYCSSDTINNLSNKETTTNGEPVSKKQKITQNSFDPVAGHRYWCPWIQSRTLPDSSQSFSPRSSPLKSPSLTSSDHQLSSPVKHTPMPTWLHVALILSKHEYLEGEEDFLKQLKQSPQIEGLRHIRQVLKDCTSPPAPKRPVFSGLSPGNVQ